MNGDWKMKNIEKIDKLIWYSLLLFSGVCGVYRGALYVFAGLLIILGVVRYCIRLELPVVDNRIKWGMCVFLFATFVSTVFSNHIMVSLDNFFRLIISFLLFFTVSQVIKEKSQIEICFKLMAISVIIGSIVAAWQGLHGEIRVKSLMGMMNFGGALGLIFPILLVQVIEYCGSVKYNLLYLVAFVFSLIGEYYNGTRAIWVTMSTTVVVYIFARITQYKKKIIIIIIGFLAVGFLGSNNVYITEKVHSMTNISTNTNNIGRINLWNYALSIFKENPIIGVGYGALPQFTGDVYKYDEVLTPNIEVARGDHVHNNLFQALAELGALGGGALIFFASSVFVSLWRNFRNSTNNKIALIGLLASLDFFIHGIFDYTLSPAGSTFLIYMVILGCTSKNSYLEKGQE